MRVQTDAIRQTEMEPNTNKTQNDVKPKHTQ